MTRRPALAFVSVLALAAAAAGATPFQPRDGAQVLEVLPWRGDPQQQELRRMRAALAAKPADLASSTALAQRYIEAGRREGDPRYFGYAQAALAPWWKLPAPPLPVRLLRATLLQSVHRFDEALRDLEAVTAADPGNAQAWLTRATVQTVRARYPEATASCARLSSLAGQLVSLACVANVGALTGKLDASERLLATAFARDRGTSPELDAWVLGALAEMAARRGDAAVAAQRFAEATRLTPRDTYLLGAYADFLLDRGQAAEARTLLEPHRNVDGLLLRHALALRAPAGDRQRAAEISELGARFAAAERRGDGVHLREQARFELELRNDVPRALALARRNWETQKELADARILLQAAVRAGDGAAARPVLDWLRASRVEAPQLAALARTFGSADSRGAP